MKKSYLTRLFHVVGSQGVPILPQYGKCLLLCLAASCLGWKGLLAQPQVTSDVVPIVGTEFTTEGQILTTFEPGPSGANQSWNFAQLTSEFASTNAYIDPQTAPLIDSFANVTHVARVASEDTAFYVYSRFANDEFITLGSYVDESLGAEFLIRFEDPKTEAIFPLSLGVAYEDSFSLNFVQEIEQQGFAGESEFFTRGKVEVLVDGHGTVTTPAGTFTDAIRIRRVESARDSVVFSFQGIPTQASIITIQDTSYLWMIDEQFSSILLLQKSISVVDAGVGGTFETETMTGFYNSEFTTDRAAKLPPELKVTLFPNPASGGVTLNYQHPAGSGSYALSLSTLHGTRVYQQEGRQAAGAASLPIPINKLSPGVYLLTLRVGERHATQKLTVH